MKRCWELDPLQRPSAGDLMGILLPTVKEEEEEWEEEELSTPTSLKAYHQLEVVQVGGATFPTPAAGVF